MESDYYAQRADSQQSYKSEGTSVVSSVVNKVEHCDYGYIFDKKSRRCIGNYFLFLIISLDFASWNESILLQIMDLL